jgi:membrane-bound inhibitor of C-type lysozyme
VKWAEHQKGRKYMRISIVPYAALIVACAGGCACAKGSGLAVRGGEAVAYRCDKGVHIVARYYSLSDDSLSFVKVFMPAGMEYTLPNALSASGARYTDDREKVWWTKGASAFVQTRDRNGEWRIEYDNCREIHK